MKINGDTKISELIKVNKASIDAIAAVAEPLHRLKNPVLRKVMASRVNIAEAARMGGCPVEAISAALAPLGFEYEKSIPMDVKAEAKPQWLSDAANDDIILFDVRPIIASGTDPLKAILEKFRDVQPGGILCVINSFVPTPLIHLLKQQKAEDSFVDVRSQKESHTYFLKKQREGIVKKMTDDKVVLDDEMSFLTLYNTFSKEKIRETDVRNMEMPVPMETILGELSALPKDAALYVHHKRIPVYLLEELADKNYEVHIYTVDDNNVKMMLFEKQ